jgi:hypothetical protein
MTKMIKCQTVQIIISGPYIMLLPPVPGAERPIFFGGLIQIKTSFAPTDQWSWLHRSSEQEHVLGIGVGYHCDRARIRDLRGNVGMGRSPDPPTRGSLIDATRAALQPDECQRIVT